MRTFDWLVQAVEWLAAGALILLSAMAFLGFAAAFVASAGRSLFNTETVLSLLDELLVLFLLIELTKMAFAYLRGTRVLPVALEAIVIALARKAVALDFSDAGALKKSAALAIMFCAVGATWLMVCRARTDVPLAG